MRHDRGLSGRAGAALLILLSIGGTLHAHELNITTAIESNVITGRVYFTGGGPAVGAVIQVMGPHREILGQVGVDPDGRFRYPASYRTEYTLRARTPDLHATETSIGPEGFSDELPPFTTDPKVSQLFEQAVKQQRTDELSTEIRQLREQVSELESSIGLRDIVGGIGFIVGILGLLMFWRQRAV